MTAEMMKKTGREIAAEIVGSALIALSTYNVALYAEFPIWCLPDPVPVVRASYGCDESGAKYSGSSALLAADRYEIYPEIPSMHAHFLDYAGLRGSVISGLRRKPDGGSHYDWRHRWNRLWADLYQWLFYRRCGFYHHGGESVEPSCEAGKYYIWH